jgi:hypothetical protein
VSRSHEVKQGDTVFSIASKYGFDDWRELYDHPDNAELRMQRPDPLTLMPGDKVAIPDREAETFDCETGQRHTFSVESTLSCSLRLVLEDDDGEPYANTPYQLVVDGRKMPKKTTDKEGLLEAELPPESKRATLLIWPEGQDDEEPLEWHIGLGHLDPIDTDSGVRGRLLNLGYLDETMEEIDEEQLSAAIAAFQQECGLTVSGIADEDTKKALVKAHGA